jgi:hypothetical protein
VLLHMLLEFVLREEGLSAFLAFELIRHKLSVKALIWRNKKEPRTSDARLFSKFYFCYFRKIL